MINSVKRDAIRALAASAVVAFAAPLWAGGASTPGTSTATTSLSAVQASPSAQPSGQSSGGGSYQAGTTFQASSTQISNIENAPGAYASEVGGVQVTVLPVVGASGESLLIILGPDGTASVVEG